MAEIIVKSENPRITKKNFCVELFNRCEALFFHHRAELMEKDSITYDIFTKGFLRCPNESADTYSKSLIIDEAFIVSEEGTMAFEVTQRVDNCKVEFDGEMYTVTITRVTDGETVKRLFDLHYRKSFGLITCVNERVGDRILDKYSDIEPSVVTNAYKNTGFIKLPEDGTYARCEVFIDKDGKYNLEQGSSFSRITNEYDKVIKKGSILWRRQEDIRNYCELYETSDFAHDYEANLVAVLKRILCYPYDAAEIKQRFPEFYDRECELYYRRDNFDLSEDDCEDVPFIDTNGKPGGGIICHKLCAVYKGISIESEALQFFMNSDRTSLIGPTSSGGKRLLRIEKSGCCCALIEADGLFNILFYTYIKNVRYENEYYAVFKYEGETGFSQWADIAPKDKRVFRGAYYLMLCGLLKPIAVNREEFEETARTRNP